MAAGERGEKREREADKERRREMVIRGETET